MDRIPDRPLADGEKLGLSYALADTVPPDVETVERVCEVFRAAGLKTY